MPELVYDNEAIQKLERVRRDRDWFNHNYKLVKEHFNEKFIAIKDEEIIDNDENLESLLRRITTKYPKNHRSIIIEHITDEKPVYVL